MAVPVDMIKLVQRGLINGSQTWSWGVWGKTVLSGTPTSSDLAAFLTAAEPYLTTFWSTWKTKNVAALTYTGLSAYFYPSGSATATLVANQSVSSAPGTGSQPTCAREALVVSILTDGAGRSSRGRFYIPYTGENAGASLFAPSATCDSIASQAQVMAHGMAVTGFSAPFTEFFIGVRSDKLSTYAGAKSFRVDNKIDTQRRREDKLPATYSKVVASGY